MSGEKDESTDFILWPNETERLKPKEKNGHIVNTAKLGSHWKTRTRVDPLKPLKAY